MNKNDVEMFENYYMYFFGQFFNIFLDLKSCATRF